jgi:hypothetical protein
MAIKNKFRVMGERLGIRSVFYSALVDAALIKNWKAFSGRKASLAFGAATSYDEL